jgi:hypothetical protein
MFIEYWFSHINKEMNFFTEVKIFVVRFKESCEFLFLEGGGRFMLLTAVRVNGSGRVLI